jgi:hypothetical protein
MSYVDKVYVGKAKIQVKFRARWRDPSGKEKAKTFDTRRQALDFLVKIDAAKLTSSYVDPNNAKMLVKDYAEQWLAGRDVRPTTEARDASLFRTHIIPRSLLNGRVSVDVVDLTDRVDAVVRAES